MSLLSRRKAAAKAGTPPEVTSLPPRTDGSLKDGDLATPMRLDEFLRQLAIILQLPPRVVKAAAPIAAVARHVKMPSTRWALPIAAVVCVGVYAATLVKPAPVIAVPPQMLGQWGTEQGAYKGRRFTITPETIVIAEGPSDVVHRLITFEAADRRDTTLVSLTYDNEGKSTPMGFRYTTGGRPAIVLDHPWDVVWYRVDPDSAARVASALTPAQ